MELLQSNNLVMSFYGFINPKANINKSVSISSKIFACHTGFNSKQEDLIMLPCNVSVRNFVWNSDKPTIKYVRKSIFKSISTSSALPGKPISNSTVNILI